MITKITKAQPVAGEIPDETIEISGVFPRIDNLDEMAILYEQEADNLFEVLRRSLPGGTIDRLTAKLLLLQASLLIIPRIGDD